MTKPKDLVKVNPAVFVLMTTLVFTGWLVVAAQSTAPQFDARMLPSLEKLSTGEDVERIQRQLDDLEKKILKDSRASKGQYCDALFNFVVFRYRLQRASPKLPAAPAADTRAGEEWRAFSALLDKNIVRAEDLFAEGEKGCSQEVSNPTVVYLMAKFCNAWLFDNVRAGFAQKYVLPIDRPRLEKRGEQNLVDYVLVLKEFRSRDDKSWIDPVLLLYSYANALARRDEFETAEPLLFECLTIASQKYGANSATLLPVLRLLAGIARLGGDETEYQKYREWMGRLGVPEKEQEIVFDLRLRANPKSVTALSLENKILIAGPRGDLGGRPPDLNLSNSGYEIPMADLPFAPGQGIRDNRMWYDSKYSQFAVRAFITVSDSGDVTSVDVQNSNPKIADRVLKVAKALKFKPLTYKGRATAMKGLVRIWVRYDYK